MSKIKAALIEEGKKYGIDNGADMSWEQLDREIRALKAQAEPVKPPKKKTKQVKKRPTKRILKSSDFDPADSGDTSFHDRTAGRLAREAAVAKDRSSFQSHAVSTDSALDTATRTNLEGQKRGRVELRKGLVRYYYVIKGANGEIKTVSQKYYSKYNAERAAYAEARAQGLNYAQRTY